MSTDTSAGSCGAGGELDHTFVVSMDKCSHEQYVGFSDSMPIQIVIDGNQVSQEIPGDPGLEAVSGEVDESCALMSTGTGTVAGYPDIQIDWDGTVNEQGFTGSLTLGADGQLPGECPIIYAVAPA